MNKFTKKIPNRYDKNYRGFTSGADFYWGEFINTFLFFFCTIIIHLITTIMCAINHNQIGATFAMVIFFFSSISAAKSVTKKPQEIKLNFINLLFLVASTIILLSCFLN